MLNISSRIVKVGGVTILFPNTIYWTKQAVRRKITAAPHHS